MRKLKIIAQYFAFVAQSRKWWLLPIFLSMLVLGAILVLTQSSPAAPFIYTLF